MKSRNLNTVHNLIASEYKITRLQSGKFLHSFKPATTSTVYEFEANATPMVREGERYNIGYTVDATGRNIVETSSLSLASEVNPTLSYAVAQNMSRGISSENRAKNDDRVTHSATDGYYWGKKYAWRAFGLAIARNAFDEYLEEIKHPSVPCTTQDPNNPQQNNQSVAYKEDGLEDAIYNLIFSAQKNGAYYKSPLYSKKFQIKGVDAITDKK